MPDLTNAQQAERAKGIGGSEAAAAIGLSDTVTPLDLYRNKVHGERLPISVPEFSLWLGHQLEPVVAECFAHPEHGTGLALEVVDENFINPDHPFIRGYIDRRVIDRREGVELKAWSAYSRKMWGETGTDDVPIGVLCQNVHYILATGYDCWHTGALLGNEFRHYTVRPNETVLSMVRDGEREFWQRVVERDPPPAMNLNDIKYLFQRAEGDEVMIADDDLLLWHRQLFEAREQVADIEARSKLIEFQIKKRMKNAARLVHPDDPDRRLATWIDHDKQQPDIEALKQDKLWPLYSESISVRPLRLMKP